MTTRSMISLLAGVAAAAISVSAQAVTITQTITIPSGLTDFATSNSFNLFDTSLGTLNSITLSDTYSITTSIDVTNTGTSASSGTVKTESELFLGAADAGQNAVLTALAVNYFDLLTSPTQTYSLAAGASVLGLTGSKNGSATGTTSVAGHLAAFSLLGGGTGTINTSTFTQTLLGNNGGNTSATQTTFGSGSFTIVYNYDVAEQVPEPAMLGLFGLGAIGLGLARRRKAA